MTGQDMQAIVEYLRPADPVASVYTGSPPVHDTGLTWKTRWSRLAGQLHCDGAEEALVRAIEHAVIHPIESAVAAWNSARQQVVKGERLPIIRRRR